jgi:hypothetical protein
MATETLTCEYGKGHTFSRTRTRGPKPKLCPKHRGSVPASVQVAQKIRKSAPPEKPLRATQPVAQGVVSLHCEAGNHAWQRASQRGRRPTSCPEHSAATPAAKSGKAIPAGPGLATVTDLSEYRAARDAADAVRQAKERRAKERIDNLEMMLKSSGLHLSQNPVGM